MQVRPYRSILFLPATRPQWVGKTLDMAVRPDACIVDLEDSVSSSGKAEARSPASDMVRQLAAAGMPVYVRINALSGEHWLEDIRAVTLPGLVGVGLSKARDASQIQTLADALERLEVERGIEPGSVDIQPLLETAGAMFGAYEILTASPRVRSYFAGSAKDGDIIRELGARWTPRGAETLYVRSKLLLEGRAAGVPYPISGTWAEVSDLPGLRLFAEESRDIGYTGMYVIHPSHIEVVNDVFTPTPDEIRYYQKVLASLEVAIGSGTGAARMDGSMIDVAMAARARAFLDVAESLGLDVAPENTTLSG
jgi:citrate lyase subunit beta/citryl-CoA lyase